MGTGREPAGDRGVGRGSSTEHDAVRSTAADPDDRRACRPPVTVVVATRDRPRLLAQCLAALSSSIGDRDTVVVVDSASTDPDVADVARHFGALVIRSHRPGTCVARNLGWQAATTELVLFTDDDCRPAASWVTAIATAMARRRDIAFVTGRVLANDDATGRARVGLSLLLDEQPREFRHPQEAARAGHGANMAWRRSTLVALGGFDEQLGPGAPGRGAEDQDLLWRALRGGAAGRYEPAAIVVHQQWRTRPRQLQTYFSYGVGSGTLAVKQWRSDGAARGDRKLLEAARALLWEQGARQVARSVVEGHQMGALAEAVKLAGTVRGAWGARHAVVVDGHIVSARFRGVGADV